MIKSIYIAIVVFLLGTTSLLAQNELKVTDVVVAKDTLKATKINPLAIKSLTKALCFIDGDNKNQLSWVKQKCGENPLNKIILVNGDFAKISQDHKRKYPAFCNITSIRYINHTIIIPIKQKYKY